MFDKFGFENSAAPCAVDLFCGAGGFSIGLERAGFDIRLAVDSWHLAVQSYARNFSHPVICADLSVMSGGEILSKANTKRGEVDLVVGGPPCQGFSIQRIGSDYDLRNSLVMDFARLVDEIAPRIFIMENVPGLLGKRGRALFEAFLVSVGKSGYEVEAHVVNAADFGVAQLRRRVVILGRRRGEAHSLEMPRPTCDPRSYLTVQDAIGDLAPPTLPKAQPSDPLHRQTRMSELNLERLRHIPPGGGMEDLPIRLRVDCHKAGADKIGHRNVYGRLASDRPAGTITARFDSFTRGKFAHPIEDRNITLREGARLQSFPDHFCFVGNQEDIACQIGNAVPPLLGEALARAVRKALNSSCSVKDHILEQTEIGLPSGTSD
ncbi:DNA cytosine methyltransferase [Paracoccus sp. ME4]|uniref:DNA cytosine methyltransferase n=1 Tax=Paracoccus sp. ME4 TaxID=3138066 RepID=UPI00398A8FA4